jgi:transcriptional regulator with XRE-family HTH domain
MTSVELRNLRRRCNVTQRQLAGYLDVSRSSIGRWERGEAYIPVTVALALSQEAVQEDLRAINGVNLPLWQQRPERRRRRASRLRTAVQAPLPDP